MALNLFDESIVDGACPHCGERTRKTVRWFRDAREAVALRGLQASLREPASDAGTAAEGAGEHESGGGVEAKLERDGGDEGGG